MEQESVAMDDRDCFHRRARCDRFLEPVSLCGRTRDRSRKGYLQALSAQTSGQDWAMLGRFRVCVDNRTADLQALQETGATGLEPATSGVTGRASVVTILHGAIRKSLKQGLRLSVGR
jgi:hypothetical protein